MMTFKEFERWAVSNVLGHMPPDYRGAKVETHKVEKLGASYTGMTVAKEGQRIVATVNLDELYDMHKKGARLSELMRTMVQIAMMEPPPMRAPFLESYEEVKDRLFVRLSSLENARARLGEMPHRMIGDMVLTYHVLTGGRRGDIWCAGMTYSLLEEFGISEEQLHEDSLRSSALILPARMETAESIRKRAASLDLEDFSDDPEADDAVDFGGGSADAEGPSYLMLTNEQRTFGASVVLYPGVLDMAAEELGGDVYLIPSSVNEFILVPVSLVPEAEELEASISYVNETLVAPSEILSKRLYHYDLKTKRLEFAIQYLVQ